MSVKTQLTFRNYLPSDMDTVLPLINHVRKAMGEPDPISRENLEHQLNGPLIDPKRDILIALDGDTPVALSTAFLNPAGQAISSMFINPDYESDDLRRHLIQRVEATIRSRMDSAVDAGRPVILYISSLQEKQQEAIKLYQSLGYEEARRFYVMQIELDEAPVQPQFPDGIELRPFDPEKHGHAVHQAHEEAFRDHWGYVEDRPYERWAHRFSAPSFDPSLYIIAWDSDEVAGVAFCRAADTNPQSGWVDTLGVRRPWRRQGLGLALLHEAFRRFYERGRTTVNLGVDATSQTNAVALYERAGMHVHQCEIAMQKVLREKTSVN